MIFIIFHGGINDTTGQWKWNATNSLSSGAVPAVPAMPPGHNGEHIPIRVYPQQIQWHS